MSPGRTCKREARLNRTLLIISNSRGTCLWLWLGVLDAIQGVGLYVSFPLKPGCQFLTSLPPANRGMILLQTLSRLHVCATLAIAQMLGSVVVIIARATAPNRVSAPPRKPAQETADNRRHQNGPAGVFPDAALWDIGGGDGSMNPLGVSSPSLTLILPLSRRMVCSIGISGWHWYAKSSSLSDTSSSSEKNNWYVSRSRCVGYLQLIPILNNRASHKSNPTITDWLTVDGSLAPLQKCYTATTSPALRSKRDD